MRTRLFAVLFSLLSFQLVAQNSILKESVVDFEIDGIAWTTVEGQFKGMEGTVIFDKNNLALSFISSSCSKIFNISLILSIVLIQASCRSKLSLFFISPFIIPKKEKKSKFLLFVSFILCNLQSHCLFCLFQHSPIFHP